MTLNSVGFFVGTYNGPDGDGNFSGDGIFYVQLDNSSGAMSEPIAAARCANPSYLARGPSKKHLYAVKEVEKKHHPEILCFAIEGDGVLRLLNRVAVESESPCHLAVNDAGTFLACAQYSTGNVLLFALKPDGKIGALAKNIQHFGNGPDTARQKGPHAHFVSFLTEPDQLAIVDLGLDRVFNYPLSADGNLDIKDQFEAGPPGAVLPAGVGPRHFATVSGSNFIYVFCEMQAIIFVFQRTLNALAEVQVINAFESISATPDSGAAIKISPGGRFLYVCERSRSKIAVFSIDQKNGKISPVQSISSNGKEPRDISISTNGKFLIAANQKSNNLSSFYRDLITGKLKPTGYEIEINQPVCILF